MSNIKFDKVLVKKAWEREAISQWVKQKQYELAIVSLSDHMLQLHLNVAFGPIKQFADFMRDRYDHELQHDDANALFVYGKGKDGQRYYFINVQSNSFKAKDYGTLAHELHHYVHMALYNSNGVEYSREGEEVYAYAIGYFMELLTRALAVLTQKQPALVMRYNKLHKEEF